MILGSVFAIALMAYPVQGSLQIYDYEYPLMQYTKLISEEHLTAGRPLVIVLPQAEEDSTNKDVGYLIENLHISGRWPMLVYNMSSEMNANMYTEIYKHGSYIIPILGPCKEGEEYISHIWQHLFDMSRGEITELSWNPRAQFIVTVISKCMHLDNTHISKTILQNLWPFGIMNPIVLFLKTNAHEGNDLQQTIADAEGGMYLELHTWYPYENSDRCNPDEGTVPVRVLTVRNLSDIRSDIFKKYFNKNLHGCPLYVHVDIKPPYVYPPKTIWQQESGVHDVYKDGIGIELLRMIGYSLNASMDIEDSSRVAYRNVTASVYLGEYATYSSALDDITEQTHSYLTVHFAWYTPCAVKYHRWNRFFNIFSVDMWICFVLSLVLAVITVLCISNYGHKFHLQEFKSYSNIFAVTSNIIAILLSVSVNTQPRSASLRLFFFCWVCYCVAISTVFQAYLTTFLIEPGYEKPISTVDQMLRSERKFGFIDEYELFFENVSNSVDQAFLENAIQCPDRRASFKWVAAYMNVSIILEDMNVEIIRDMGKLLDENNRPLLCKLQDGGVGNLGLVLLVIRGSPLLEFINDIIEHIVEAGIITHIKKRDFSREEIVGTWDDFVTKKTYIVFGVSHLQTAFYLLIIGYVLAVVCFVTEILWHCYGSKG